MLGLLSIQACGVGITLSPRVSTVVMLELPMTPALALQCEDRVHRVNTERPVHIYYLVARGSFDEDVFAMLANKARTNAGVIDGAESSFIFAED